jgi:BirA family biotin operon repressor/biotin-[acetyl-CoA-carboxylase] ligase
MAEGGAPHGTLIVADSQTDGRGRLDRKWVSPGGVNIYFSLVLRPEIPLAVAPLVGLAASLAVARSVGFHVKWPNDVVDVHGKKAAGVLSEVHTAEGQVDFLILGIGLNVNQTRFDPELSNATSLKLHREVDIERVGLLRSIVSSLDAWVPTVWLARDRLLGTWQRHCSMMGHEVRVEGVTGRAIDLRSDGALLIETLSGQIVPVLTGDVESGGLR